MSDLLAPQDRVKQNEQLVRALGTIVKQNYVIRVSGREYLTVAGAQAIASGMGLTTTTEQLRHVPATDGMTGYWEATSTVVDQRGVVLGRGVGCVFDDEKPWNTRPQFARQMMAQTRATGRSALRRAFTRRCPRKRLRRRRTARRAFDAFRPVRPQRRALKANPWRYAKFAEYVRRSSAR